MILTISFEVDGASAEAATRLAEEWAARRLGAEGPLRPIRVVVGDDVPEPWPSRRRRRPRPDTPIARMRERAGLTQAGLARRARVSPSTVSLAEYGQLRTTSDSYRRIAQALREALATASAGEHGYARGAARPRRGDRAVPTPPGGGHEPPQ